MDEPRPENERPAAEESPANAPPAAAVPDPKDRVWLGAFWLILWHIGLGICSGGIALIFVGFLQFIYGLPMYFHYEKMQRPRAKDGLVIAMTVSALVNGGCWTYACSTM